MTKDVFLHISALERAGLSGGSDSPKAPTIGRSAPGTGKGALVFAAPEPDPPDPAVMYQPGKILYSGGARTTTTAEVIDLKPFFFCFAAGSGTDEAPDVPDQFFFHGDVMPGRSNGIDDKAVNAAGENTDAGSIADALISPHTEFGQTGGLNAAGIIPVIGLAAIAAILDNDKGFAISGFANPAPSVGSGFSAATYAGPFIDPDFIF